MEHARSRPRSRRSLIVGIDLGTSSLKAILFDSSLAEIDAVHHPLVTARDASGRSEQAMDAIGRALERALGQLAAAARRARGAIAAIGICAHRSSLVAYDAAGRFTSPLVLWNDHRAAATLATLRRRDARALNAAARAASLPLLPYFFAPRAAWRADLASVGPGLAPGTRFLSADAALLALLGGEPVMDRTVAARTLLATPRGAWRQASLAAFGLDRARMPQIGESLGDHGALRGDRVPPSLRGIPILASLADQSACCFGLASDPARETVLVLGTGAFAIAAKGRPDPARGVLPILISGGGAGTPELLGVEANDPSIGTSFERLAELFALPRAPAAFESLVARATATPRVVPALSGLGAPWLAPQVRGALLDLDAATTRADLAAGLVSGAASRIADLIDAVSRKGEVIAGGGGARSDSLLAAVADLSGRSVRRGKAREPGALGAARLAAAAAGIRGLDHPLEVDRGEGVTSFEPRLTSRQRRRTRDHFAAAIRALLATRS